MSLERFPIRVAIPLDWPARSDVEQADWPGFWRYDPRGVQVVSAVGCVVAVPDCYSTRRHAGDLVTVSRGAIDCTGSFARDCLPASVAASFPCLCVQPETGELTFYAHPLGRGTFFYARARGYLLFSTSMHDLCRAVQSYEPDEEGIADYLFSIRMLQSDPGRTLIRGISQIPPGSRLTCVHGEVALCSYWKPHTGPHVHTLEMREAVFSVREALQQAVARSIAPAQNVGCYYSGGVDSTVVAAYALQHLRHQRTNAKGRLALFSAGIDVSTVEETRLRRAFADAAGCPLYEIPIDLSQDIVPVLRRANRSAPLPSNGLFAVVNETLAEAAHDLGIELMLSGEGGEELFGENDMLLADLLLRGRWWAAYHCLCYLTSISQRRWKSLIYSGLLPGLAVAQELGRWGVLRPFLSWAGRTFLRSDDLSEKNLRPLYGDDYASGVRQFHARQRRDLQHCAREGWALSDYQALLCVRDVPQYEPNLTYLDSFQMPVVSPLTDPGLFEACLTLKLEERVRTGVGFRGKTLLRCLGRHLVPPAVLAHPKINISDTPWRILRHSYEAVLEELHSPALRRLGIVPCVSREDLIQDPPFGHLLLMHLLILGIWLEELQSYVEAACC